MEIFLLTWSGSSTYGKFYSSSIPQEMKKKLKNFSSKTSKFQYSGNVYINFPSTLQEGSGPR